MRRVIRFTADQLRPQATEVLRRQWMPAAAVVSPRLHALFSEASAAFDELAQPVAVIDEVSCAEFGDIYAGVCEPNTPMGRIYPRATALALFAATLGNDVETAVRRRFRAQDAPVGFALDAFASASADRLVDLLAAEYRSILYTARRRSTRVVAYSPGYCGWNVTGQAKLFARLRPGDIGIRLSDRCLMHPAKSVSGVLVAGPRELHIFKPSFPCCAACSTRDCVERMAALRGPESPWTS